MSEAKPLLFLGLVVVSCIVLPIGRGVTGMFMGRSARSDPKPDQAISNIMGSYTTVVLVVLILLHLQQYIPFLGLVVSPESLCI